MGGGGRKFIPHVCKKLWVCLIVRKRLKNCSVLFCRRSSRSSSRTFSAYAITLCPCEWPCFPLFSHFVQQYPGHLGDQAHTSFFLYYLNFFNFFLLFTLPLAEGNYSSLATEFAVVPPFWASMNHLFQRRWKAPQ